MRTLVDDMKDSAAAAYAAFPDRLFLIDRGGRILYAGDRGPWGFKPAELEVALERRVGVANAGDEAREDRSTRD